MNYSKAQIAQSVGNVKNNEASLELAKANETRMRSLFEKEYVSKQELDQSVQALKSAEAQLSTTKAQLKRDIDQRNFYDKWWKANSTYDGAEDAWFSGEGGRSLFERPELKSYRAKTSAAEQIPTSQGVSITPIYARNPQTNQRIMSTDGGKTWQAAR